MKAQVKKDGSHFEQSTYYHLYALDFFLLHAALEEVDDHYRDGLARMAEFLATIVDEAGNLPLLGDDDGGRLFHPYGKRSQFARATLATASVMLGHSLFPLLGARYRRNCAVVAGAGEVQDSRAVIVRQAAIAGVRRLRAGGNETWQRLRAF